MCWRGLHFACTTFALVSLYGSSSAFNLYVDQKFGKGVLKWSDDLFGQGHLYIIKDDNPYPTTVHNPLFPLIIIQSTNKIELTWDSEPNQIVRYRWSFDSSNLTVMGIPFITTNISGIVPKHDVFYYVLPCTGKNPGTERATVELDYNITTKASNSSETASTATSNHSVRLSTKVDCRVLAPMANDITTGSRSEPSYTIKVGLLGLLLAVPHILL
jgi:hypothetical protein